MKKFMNILREASVKTDTAPPEYEAGDAAHYAAREETGFFGAQAAGCVMMAKTTGRIMLVLRSAQVDQPGTWGNLGGAHHSDERPIAAAKREAHEETGYAGAVQMIPLLVFQKGSFRYSNFLAIVEDEFEPQLGWEADKAVWTTMDALPKPLHFGMESLFNDAASAKTIQHYAGLFAKDEAVEEAAGLEMPNGVNTKDAIEAAKKIAADPTLTAPEEETQPGIPGSNKPAAPAKPGEKSIPAKTAPTNAPAGKKSLAPITSQ